MKLPEATDPTTAIIIGSLDENGDPATTSNRGNSKPYMWHMTTQTFCSQLTSSEVDYWVMGCGVAYADRSSFDGMDRATGTSFGNKQSPKAYSKYLDISANGN